MHCARLQQACEKVAKIDWLRNDQQRSLREAAWGLASSKIEVGASGCTDNGSRRTYSARRGCLRAPENFECMHRGVLGLFFTPLCDIPSGCCSFTGPWTVTCSSLRMLRRVAAFCRPLRPVLLPVSFPRSRSPVVGVLGLCWMWHGAPFACQRRPIIGVLRMCCPPPPPAVPRSQGARGPAALDAPFLDPSRPRATARDVSTLCLR